jgi:hypothetical protein
MGDDAPIPNNADTRPPDILREQSEKTASKDPVSATGADLPRQGVGTPPPSTPPPFPDFPLQAVSQIPTKTTESVIFEAAKAAVVDVFKNVTINGEPPSSSGMGFNFSIKNTESVSEAFARMNSPAADLQKTIILPPEPVASNQTASQQQPVPVQQNVFDTTPQGGSRLRLEQKPFDTTPQGGSHLPDSSKESGTPIMKQTAETSRIDGTHKMAGGGHGGGGGGHKWRDDDKGDPMGKGRLHGETHTEYDKRQKAIKGIKEDPSAVGAIASGDTSYFYKGAIPVLLTRGDTLRKIKCYLEPSFSGVVEGISAGERPADLPEPSGYYIGGLPSGCPYDFYAQLEGTPATTASFLAAVKHTECNEHNVGNKTFERYAALSAEADDCGYWAYFGVDADWNFKAIVKSDQTTASLFNSASSVFAETLVKDDESSVWGYTESGDCNYSLKAKASKADLVLWNSSGPTSSLWADGSTAGMKVENPDGDYCFADLGKLWVAYEDGSNAQIYGGGAYMEAAGGDYVDINTASCNGHSLYIQEMEICGGQKIMVLCSDPY